MVISFWKKKIILDRWAECIGELFIDHRKAYNVIKDNFASPPVMKDQIRGAINNIKLGNPTG